MYRSQETVKNNTNPPSAVAASDESNLVKGIFKN